MRSRGGPLRPPRAPGSRLRWAAAVAALAAWAATATAAAAQCAMCRTALAAPGGRALAAALRDGTLLLLTVPFAAVLWIGLRVRRSLRRQRHGVAPGSD